MGVYINMEMPRFVYREIRIHPDGKVTERPHPEYPGYEECLGKAVPVPPHGRLIDADEAIGHLFNGEQCLYSWDEIEDAIDATETIIPAEEGE